MLSVGGWFIVFLPFIISDSAPFCPEHSPAFSIKTPDYGEGLFKSKRLLISRFVVWEPLMMRS